MIELSFRWTFTEKVHDMGIARINTYVAIFFISKNDNYFLKFQNLFIKKKKKEKCPEISRLV